MIKVSMRKNNATHFFLFPLEVIRVGNNIVNAWHVFFRKLQTNVNNDDVVAIFKHRHIAPDLFLPAKRDDTKGVLRNWRYDASLKALWRSANRISPSFSTIVLPT